MNNDYIYLSENAFKEYVKTTENLLINLARVEERMSIVKTSNLDIEDYKELVKLRTKLKKQIEDRNDKMNKIKIVEEHDSLENDIIDIGDVVKIISHYKDEENVEEIYELVAGASDENCEIEKLSINSPKGKKLYKSKVGSSVYVPVGKNEFRVDIKEKINVKKLSLEVK